MSSAAESLRYRPESLPEALSMIAQYEGLISALKLKVGGTSAAPATGFEPEQELEIIAGGIDRLLASSEDAARKYHSLHSPEILDFLKGVEAEALYQRERWGTVSDTGKERTDWFWLVGNLLGKAINKPEKRLHHIITAAAVCLNWHAAEIGSHTAMRPGIDGEVALPSSSLKRNP